VCGVLFHQSEEEWSKYGIRLLCAYESKIGVLGRTEYVSNGINGFCPFVIKKA
jgi:hypothetical protein